MQTQSRTLERAIATAKSGDKATARQILAEVVKAEPRNETAWMWLAFCAKTKAERKRYLERVLDINPVNFKAQEALERLIVSGTPVSEAKKETPSTAKVILAIGTACGPVGLFVLPYLLGIIALVCGIAAATMGEKKGRTVALLGIVDIVVPFLFLYL